MSSTSDHPPLWVELVPERLGFGRLTRSLGLPAWGTPYLFVVTLYVIDLPVLSGLTPLRNPGSPVPYVSNPFGNAMLGIGLVFGVWAARRLRTGFGNTVGVLPDPMELPQTYPKTVPPPASWLLDFGWSDRPDEFDFGPGRRPVSGRLKVFLLLVAWALYLAHLVRNPTSPENVYEVAGPVVASIKVWIIVPLGYLPLAVDLIGGYVGVVGLLPLAIRRQGLIDFRDPLGYGGLKPVGDRIKSATVYYFLALAAYSAWITSGDVLGSPFAVEVQSVITAFIVGGSVLGVVLFFLPPQLPPRLHCRRKAREDPRDCPAGRGSRPPDGPGDVPGDQRARQRRRRDPVYPAIHQPDPS